MRPRPGADSVAATTPTGGRLLWYDVDPRVLTPGGSGQVRVIAKLSEGVQARLVLRNTVYPFTAVGTTWLAIVPQAEMLEQYRTGNLRHTAGRIEVGTTPANYNVVVNVAPPGVVVPVVIASLASGVKATPHALNIRTDSIYNGRTVPASIAKEAYKYLKDDYDFLFVVQAVSSANGVSYTAMRNDVVGIGLSNYDQGKVYGSSARLQGVVDFPSDEFFDPAGTATLQQLTHRWANYIRVPVLHGSAPHWPISDLAYGILGFSNPNFKTIGLPFPYQLEPQANGNFITRKTTAATEFNDLELYLMGLLPADSVRPHFVFRNQAQLAQVRPDGTLQGPIDTVLVSDVIAKEGLRAPGYPSAPRNFTVATIVLSRGRLLTNAELWYFDNVAARAEASAVLPLLSDQNIVTTKPFYLATGNRGRLQATLKF